MKATSRSPRSPIRVLHVIQNLNYGGMERVLTDLVNALDPDSFESHVLPLQYVGRFGADLAPTAHVHQPPKQGRFSMVWPRALAATIRTVRPHVVHSHSGVWYKAARAARAAGVRRIVHTEHGRHVPDPAVARLVDRLAAGMTDVVVAVSPDLRPILVERVGVPTEKVVVIPNGVSRRARSGSGNAPLRARLSIPDGAPIIASVGRLEPVKGFDVLMRAFAGLKGSAGLEDAVLLVAGDGTQRATLEALAEQLGVEAHVRLPGWVDDVAEILDEAAVFALASHSEGTSISVLEAMAAGLCPVVTDVGGNAEVLGPDLSHRLVAPGDPRGFAEGLTDAIANPERRASDGRIAAQRVADHYGVARMAAAYADVYEGGTP